MIFNPNDEIIRIEKFIKRTMETYNFKGAVIGVSGGIDSAVVLALLTRTIEKENILALILPERDSSRESVRDAKLVCNYFGVNYKIFPITGALRKLGAYSLFPPVLFIPESIKIRYSKKRWERYQDPYIMDLKNEGDELFLKGLAYYRIKHRVRMCKLYMEAEKRGYCVVGTTNKTELALGLYVKWGDDAVDIEPIKHLYKMQVFELAKHLGVPEKIINKKPTPDLIPGINDEDVFGIDYPKLDKILFSIEHNEEKVEDADKKLLLKVKEIMRFTRIRELKGLGIDDILTQKDRW